MPHDHSWVLGLLPRELAPSLELRNAGAHSHTTAAASVERTRRNVLGIGVEGLLTRLVRTRLRCR